MKLISNSFNRTVSLNYVSQIIATAFGLLFLPVYMKMMGPEGYGLVSFFSVIQASFSLLDLGLSPTVSRETSKYKAKVTNDSEFIQVIGSIRGLFYIVATCGIIFLVTLIDFFSEKWLIYKTLNDSDVSFCLLVICFAVGVRWLSGYYRGILIGSEKINYLSVINIVFSFLKFPFVILVMYLLGASIIVFFVYQAFVIFVEFFILFFISRRGLPRIPVDLNILNWYSQWKKVAAFSLSIAITTAIWVVVTQLDKIILSGVLSLSDYGFFTLAVLISSGIMMVAGPIVTPLIPRLTSLIVTGELDSAKELYFRFTKISALLSIVPVIIMVGWGYDLIFIWSNDHVIADKVTPMLKVYSIGYFVLVFSAFPGYYQSALGNMKYHLAGNILILLCLVPSCIYFANLYGGIGAAWVWTVVNLLYFFLWVSYTHSKLIPNSHLRWFIDCIMKPVLPLVILAVGVQFILPDSGSYWGSFLNVSLVAGLSFLVIFYREGRKFWSR